MTKLPKFKDWVDQPVEWYQQKMDGHMYHIYVDKFGSIRCITKNNKDKTDKVLAINSIKKQIHKLPCGTHLMVELHTPGEPATEVARGIAHGDQRLEIAAFACPMLDGKDLYHEHIKIVESRVNELGIMFVPVTRAVRGFDCTFRAGLLRAALELGIEGWVLKESHMKGWYKLKPVKTIDAFVIDHQVSDSKTYVGCLRCVTLGLLNNDELDDNGDPTIHDLGECGGGFTKQFKLSMDTSAKRNSLLDKICEVAYQSITTHKKLQFPRFIRWRNDKDACQCTTEQLL